MRCSWDKFTCSGNDIETLVWKISSTDVVFIEELCFSNRNSPSNYGGYGDDMRVQRARISTTLLNEARRAEGFRKCIFQNSKSSTL